METYSFGDFLRGEMRKRNLSNHKFADLLGVSHTTINRLVEFGKKETNYPSMEFILRLAKLTNTDVGRIIAMIDPEIPYNIPDMNPKSVLLAQQIDQLSDKQRQVIEAMIEVLQESGGS